MKILVYSISSPPEKTGIGKYNGEMIEYLASNGHEVRLLTTFPYYPEWKLKDGYSKKIFHREYYKGAEIFRLWSYLPSEVTAKARILKETTYFIFSLFYLLFQKLKGYKPDIILYIAPPFFLPFIARSLFKSSKQIYHIQDFEVDAAIDLKMLPTLLEGGLKRLEQKLLSKMDLISTISDGMMKKLQDKVSNQNLYLFPNWSDTTEIFPVKSRWLHENLNINKEKKLIVYSGNVGEKQGLDKLPEVIKAFMNNSNIHFVIIGEGAYKKKLAEKLNQSRLSNYTMRGLVEKEELNDMLNSSFLQLVFQKSEGADAFLPSKLTNIFAAGIPAIVTTLPDTGLFTLIHENECAIPVGNSLAEVIKGIQWAIEHPDRLHDIREQAVKYSKTVLDKELILSGFIQKLQGLLTESMSN